MTTSKDVAAAEAVYEATILFKPWLHYNDGDRYNSQQVAAPLIKARNKLNEYIEHLQSVPFQPDR